MRFKTNAQSNEIWVLGRMGERVGRGGKDGRTGERVGRARICQPIFKIAAYCMYSR